MTYSNEYSPAYEYWSPTEDVSSFHVRALRRWLYVSLAFAVILVCRDGLWTAGLPVPLRVMSFTFAALLVMALFRCTTLAAKAFPHVRPSVGFFGRLNLLIIWVLLLAVYGYLRGNLFREIYKDACGYLITILLVRLAIYDEVWQAMRKPLLIICLLGAVIVVVTAHSAGVQTSVDGTEINKDTDATRHLMSLGYAMRTIVTPGLLLGAWGLVAFKTDRLRVLQLVAFLTYAVVLGIVFEFRGTIVTVGGVLIFFTLLSPIISGRIPIGTMVAVTLLVGTTAVATVLTGRADDVVQRFSREQIFSARVSEAEAFFNDMGPIDLVVGRGMGGYYNGPEWAPVPLWDGQRIWNSNHFGILALVLRGGFSLMIFVVILFLPVLWRRSPAWYANELNRAVTVLMPLVILNCLINPLWIVPEGIFDLLVMSMCLGRFATPVQEQLQ